MIPGVSQPEIQRQVRQQRADIDALYELVERVDQKVDALEIKLDRRFVRSVASSPRSASARGRQRTSGVHARRRIADAGNRSRVTCICGSRPCCRASWPDTCTRAATPPPLVGGSVADPPLAVDRRTRRSRIETNETDRSCS